MKSFKKVLTFVIVFCLSMSCVNAYKYQDDNNRDSIENLVKEIQDAKQLYEEFAGEKDEESPNIVESGNNLYWWPIGSVETTEVNGVLFATGNPETVRITSGFGKRLDPFGSGAIVGHPAIDISGGRGQGKVNVIAPKDGIVVYPNSLSGNDCPSSNSTSSCGGGYGNYIIIQHNDGNYTLYGHLYENSIIVKAGDSVRQGQVIAQMGTSGNSTGPHLHFEVREGQNNRQATVDPLNYVSPDNPRPVSFGGDFVEWLNSWEGHTKISGSNYVVENLGDGVTTVGPGITLEYNADRFKAHGVDVSNYGPGDLIAISIVDEIEKEVLNSDRTYIENVLAKNAITLSNNQIEALVARMYNTGNINRFVENYQKYGNTNDLYENWFFSGFRSGTQFEKGLKRRRNAEWALFNKGEYVYNR